MASTKAPLFGLDASGTVAGAIVFSKWRGRTYVRRHSVPANPKSGLQVGIRAAMKFLSQNWTALSDAIKAEWDAADAAANITSLNSWAKYNVPRKRQNKGLVRSVNDEAGTTPAAPTIAVTAQPKSNSIVITEGADAPEFTWEVYRKTTDDNDGDVSTLIAILPYATTTFVDVKLTTGTEYFYEVRGGNYDGELGALSASDSGTPT